MRTFSDTVERDRTNRATARIGDARMLFDTVQRCSSS